MTAARRIGSSLLVAALVGLVASGCSVPLNPALPPLRVGVSGDYAPFAIAAPDGTLTGLDVDVARRFARDTGRRIEFVPFRWPELTADLAAERFDVAMSGVTIRPERTFVGTFTRPIVHSGAAVLVRYGLAEDPAQLDRRGLRLAVNAGGHLERVARRLFANATLSTVTENRDLPAMLATGDVDAVVCDTFECDQWRATVSPGSRKLGPFTVDHKAYLARSRALATELDGWMRERELDGSLPALRAQWLGDDHAGSRTALDSDVDALLTLIDLRLAFMPWVAAAKAASGLPIVDETQEAAVLADVRDGARDRGLDVARATALFQAQIDAARAIQREWAALPVTRRPRTEAVDLQRTLRPALAEVSRAILQQAAIVAQSADALAAISPRGMQRLLDPGLTPAAHRQRLVDAVQDLRPAAGRSLPPNDR